MDSLQISRRRRQRADRGVASAGVARKSRRIACGRKRVRPTSSRRAAGRRRPAQPGRISGDPSYLGDGTFAASEEFLFTRAISRPAVRVVFRLARGFARGDCYHNSVVDLPAAAVAISSVSARLSHRWRAMEAPRGSPCVGPFSFRQRAFAARLRAFGQAPISARKRQ